MDEVLLGLRGVATPVKGTTNGWILVLAVGGGNPLEKPFAKSFGQRIPVAVG